MIIPDYFLSVNLLCRVLMINTGTTEDPTEEDNCYDELVEGAWGPAEHLHLNLQHTQIKNTLQKRLKHKIYKRS